MAEISRAILKNLFAGGGETGKLFQTRFVDPVDIDDRLQIPLKVEAWSHSLKTALSILFNAFYPTFLVWGHDRILFYNDAYLALLRENNVLVAFGEPINGTWDEAWKQVRSDVEQVFTTGQPLQRESDPFPKRQDVSENSLFRWSYHALWDEQGEVSGVFATGCQNIFREITAEQIGEAPWQNNVQESQHSANQTLQQAKAALRQSEARFQAFMSHSPTAAWIVDRDGHLLYLSPTYIRMFQLPQPEVIGKPIQEIYGEEFAQQFLENNRQVFETRQMIETIETAPRSDGSTGSFLVYKFPIFQESGAMLLGGVAIDITEREETEKTLRQRGEELRLITNGLPVLIAYVDRHQYYRFNNQTYETWFGRPAITFMGKHVREVLGEAAYEMVLPYMKQALSGQRVKFESEIAYRGVSPLYVSAEYIPHVNSQGEVEGYFSLVNDISDRKQVEAALIEQEQRYRYIFEAVSIAIWEEDFSEVKAAIDQLKEAGVHQFRQYFAEHPDFVQEAIGLVKLRNVNQAALRLFGAHSKTELLTSLNHIFVPETQEIFIEELLAIAAEEPFFAAETVLQTLQGQRIHVWVTITFPPTPEPYNRVLVCLLDTTERKQAEAILRESEERYRYLVESIPQLVWTANAEGVLIDINQRWSTFTGLSLAQVQTLGWEAVVHPDDIAALNQNWVMAQQNNTDYHAEGRMRGVNGVYRWFLHQAVPLKNEQGQLIKWFGTATDIEDQKQLEQQRVHLLQQEQAAREEAETANRIKDEFLAVLSHELRSPLNPILGWARLLQQGKLDPAKTQQALATIERNAQLQSELIEDLLDVSRILQGKLSLAVSPVNLATTICAAIETVRLAAEAKSIQLETLLDPEVGLVSGDATRLQQVVWNLLSNAVKFTPTGGQVAVRLETVLGSRAAVTEEMTERTLTTHDAQITVSDTGKGISSTFLPHVFDYFRQEDGATTRKFGGLGLGLAIVRHLVELHGGTIQAESQGEGLGATFIVRLPLMSTQVLVNQGMLPPEQSPNLQGVRILVVDDDADTRELIIFVLDQAGATVFSAASAQEAFVVLSQAQPDVLISDIGMPDMDGYGLIRQVRSLPPEQGGQIPAIALSAYAGEIDHRQALAVGFQRHISKPVEPEALVQAVAAFKQPDIT